MRHQVAGVRLSRTSSHRRALFSNLIAALFEHERIRTTLPKARETRRQAERTITVARRLGEVLTKEKRSPEEAARYVTAIRHVRSVVRNRESVSKLFDEIAPRFLGRAGGYTRIVKLAQRPGDAAPMALLELMPDESATAKPAEGGKSGGKGKAAAAKETGGEAKAAPKARAKAAADKGEGKGEGQQANKAAAKPRAKSKTTKTDE